LTNDAEFAAYVFLHNMTASETFRIKVYVRDQSAITMRQYESQDYTGVQSSPAIYIPPLLAKQYKVTIQRTVGSDKEVNWQVIEVT
jgi:hypothetical protein